MNNPQKRLFRDYFSIKSDSKLIASKKNLKYSVIKFEYFSRMQQFTGSSYKNHSTLICFDYREYKTSRTKYFPALQPTYLTKHSEILQGSGRERKKFLISSMKLQDQTRAAPQTGMGLVWTQKFPGPCSPWAPFWSLQSWPAHFGTRISFHRDFPSLWCRLQGTNLICPYISCYIYFSSKLKYVSVKCKFDNKLAYITFYCWVGHTKWSTTTLEASL